MELFTFAGALVFGTLAFYITWAVIIVATAILIGLTETERYGWATMIFVALFGGLWVTGGFNIWTYASNHTAALLVYLVYYLLVACLWGAFKWWRYCVKHRKAYDAAKADFLKAAKATEMTSELRVAWTERLKSRSNSYDRYHINYAQAPVANENKERIMNWMYLWPFSVLGTVFSDFLLRLWDWVYERMGKIYDSISRAAWKGTEEDLASEEDLANFNNKRNN